MNELRLNEWAQPLKKMKIMSESCIILIQRMAILHRKILELSSEL